MKEKFILFLVFGGIYFIFSSFIYFFSDILVELLRLALPIVITLMIVLILFNKVGWLNNIRRKYPDLSLLLMMLGAYFYCMVILGGLRFVLKSEFTEDLFATTEVIVIFVFYLVLLFWVVRLIVKTVRKTLSKFASLCLDKKQ